MLYCLTRKSQCRHSFLHCSQYYITSHTIYYVTGRHISCHVCVNHTFWLQACCITLVVMNCHTGILGWACVYWIKLWIKCCSFFKVNTLGIQLSGMNELWPSVQHSQCFTICSVCSEHCGHELGDQTHLNWVTPWLAESRYRGQDTVSDIVLLLDVLYGPTVLEQEAERKEEEKRTTQKSGSNLL